MRKMIVTVTVLVFVYLLCLTVSHRFRAAMTMMCARGKDIYAWMVTLRVELEPLGVKNCLGPKTYVDVVTCPTNDLTEITGKAYATSTGYFNDLMRLFPIRRQTILNARSDECPQFAGVGVPCSETGVLTSTNNAWAVLANVKDEDKGTLPILITRNVDIEALNRALKTGITSNDFSTPVQLGTVYKTPFGKRAGVLVRKNGQVDQLQKAHITLGMVFGDTEIPPRPDSEPPLMYLQP